MPEAPRAAKLFMVIMAFCRVLPRITCGVHKLNKLLDSPFIP